MVRWGGGTSSCCLLRESGRLGLAAGVVNPEDFSRPGYAFLAVGSLRHVLRLDETPAQRRRSCGRLELPRGDWLRDDGVETASLGGRADTIMSPDAPAARRQGNRAPRL